MSDFAQYDPSLHPDWQWRLQESRIRLTLDELHSADRKCLNGLEPTVAPTSERTDRTTRDYSANELTLVPITQSITMQKQSATTHGQIVLDQKFKHPSTKEVYDIVLGAQGGLKLPQKTQSQGTNFGDLQKPHTAFVGLCWLVKKSSIEKNAHLTMKTAQGIPVLTNKRKLKEGTELVQHVEPPPESAKRRKIS